METGLRDKRMREGGAIATFVRQHLPELSLVLIWGALLFTNLGGAAPWWDEGWTMSVARNLVERGHYGRLLLGALAPSGMEAAPPVVGMVALGLRLWGMGLWQARLLPAVCTMLALMALYLLGRQLYSKRIACGALAALLVLVALPNVHPVHIGRQVLAEMPMLLTLFLGYLALHQALARSPFWLLAAVCAFALAIQMKAQTLPFWALSLLVPLGVSFALRRWSATAIYATALGGSYLTLRYGLAPFEGLLLAGRTLPTEPVTGVTEVVAQVILPFNRLYTLRVTLTWLLPFFVGLLVAAWRWMRQIRVEAVTAAGLMRLSLLIFSGSWWAWYLALSVGVPRYVFPAMLPASLYVSALLAALTGDFAWRSTLRMVAALGRTGPNWRALGALLALLTLACYLPLSLLTLTYYFAKFDNSVERVAAYLNTTTPPAAVIETYETELHFFLQRPYHYPPDQLHVALIRLTSLREVFPLDYDPLAAKPDYVVIGPFGANNVLYDEVLQSGKLRLIHHDGLYDVYVPVPTPSGSTP